MKIFVSLIAKKNLNSQLSLEEIESTAYEVIKKQFPVLDFKSVNCEKWINNPHSIIAFVFSNENNDPSKKIFEQLSQDRIGIKLGYSDSPCNKIFTKDGVTRLDAVKKSSGQFAFISIDNTGVDLITDSVGSHPFFIADSVSHYIITSRINVAVDLVSNLTRVNLSHDLLACRDLALQGHYLGRRTGFNGIESTSVHEHTRISFHGVNRESWLDKRLEYIDFDSFEYSQLVESISDSLVNAMSILKGQDLHLSITGGRDSRLLAAILSNLPSINVTTATSGIDDNPDVILGRIISEKMGWSHKVISPKITDSSISVENPIERVRRTLDVHEKK